MGDNLGKIRAAVAQASAVFMDRDASVDKAVSIIEDAGTRGVEVLVFPEGYLPSHPLWMHFHSATSQTALDLAAELFRNSVVLGGDATQRLAAAAKRAGTWVVIGACEKRAGTTGTMWNSAIHFSPEGEIAHVHRKLTPTLGERLVHMPSDGASLKVPTADFGPVSTLICAENSNPLLTFTGSAQYAVVHAALWPNHFSPTQPLMRDVILNTSRAIAYQNGCYVLSAAGVLDRSAMEVIAKTEEDLRWVQDPRSTGGSCIVAPTGEILAGPADDTEQLLIADLDLDLLVAKRVIHDYAGHYNRPDILSLRVEPLSSNILEAHWPLQTNPAGSAGPTVEATLPPEEDLGGRSAAEVHTVGAMISPDRT